jgi:hypothetical protein
MNTADAQKRRSPAKLMLKTALLISIGFGLVHAAGWREWTAVISGTPGEHPALHSWFGMLYLMFYFGFTLAAPVLVLGALIYQVGARLGLGRI